MKKNFHTHRKKLAIAVLTWLIFFLFYYNIISVLFRPFSSKCDDYEATTSFVIVSNNSDDYLLNTPGCTIPNFAKTFRIKEAKISKRNCGKRVVFIEKTDNNITFVIDKTHNEKVFKKHDYKCCYQYALRSDVTGKEDTELKYSDCKPFVNGTSVSLENEFIKVACRPRSKKQTTYIDVYMLLRSKASEKKIREELKSWNVLLIGMDTMSRARAYHSMPNLVKYFQENDWLDFKAFQKMDFNTFPNLMTTLTGKKMSTIYKACGKGMFYCNHLMIWSKFKNHGYYTAYGEDNLNLPDTFARHKGFKIPPTDHYTRPFFLTGEATAGNLICAKTKPSALHLLDYAFQFAKAYQHEKFFGMFWINSYSHNPNNVPTLLQDHLIEFLEKLNNEHILNNTHILFFSDHGIRYGEMRVPIESYYAERLPMFFMWVPYQFRKLYPDNYRNLQVNQNRLTTHYDLHSTLWDILKISGKNVDVETSESCPNCSSLFEVKPVTRTCMDAKIAPRWCACCVLDKVPDDDVTAKLVPDVAVETINNITKPLKTLPCTTCSQLKVNKILRHHSFKGTHNRTYYVIAFEVVPGNVKYEMTIEEYDNKYSAMEGIHTISEYRVRDVCVVNINYHEFCVCKIDKQCKFNATHGKFSKRS